MILSRKIHSNPSSGSLDVLVTDCLTSTHKYRQKRYQPPVCVISQIYIPCISPCLHEYSEDLFLPMNYEKNTKDLQLV